jgi:hypothetical protein
MTISELKALEEMLEYLNGQDKVFLVGCNECATVVQVGGEPQIEEMAAKLKEHGKTVTGSVIGEPGCHVLGLRKQFREHREEIDAADALLILSAELCSACGECTLERTGNICSVTRCAKGLQNGPCGGTTADGKCEVNPETDCAWLLIYNELAEQGKVGALSEYVAPKEAQTRPGQRTLSRSGGDS